MDNGATYFDVAFWSCLIIANCGRDEFASIVFFIGAFVAMIASIRSRSK